MTITLSLRESPSLPIMSQMDWPTWPRIAALSPQPRYSPCGSLVLVSALSASTALALPFFSK